MTTKSALSSLFALLLAYFYLKSGRKGGGDPIPVKLGGIVQTNSGSIQGSLGFSRDGKEFNQWLRIPYAQPPVDQLRFASPRPIGKWEGLLDGTRNGPICPQIEATGIKGNEDCLHLNVHVPKLENQDKNRLLPVLVFIHGGAFIFGSGVQYGPEYFMDQDVLLVTINYRLNLLGFLSTGDKEIRGNMGLKDQVMALQWIKDNIQNFGGDPQRITVMGQSAGGISTHHLMLSQKTKGLFQKVISMSGAAVALTAFTSPQVAIAKTKTLAGKFNCPIENSKELTNCLRKLSMTQLLGSYETEAQNLFAIDPTKEGDFFEPIIEIVDDEEAFLVESPFNILSEGRGQNVPWLTGMVADEGLITSISLETYPENYRIIEDNWQEIMERYLLLSSFPEKERREICGKIRDFYFPPGKQLTNEEKFEKYTQIFSYGYFSNPVSMAASIQRQFSRVYLYHGNKTGGPSFAHVLLAEGQAKKEGFAEALCSLVKLVKGFLGMGSPPKVYGVSHLDDLFLLFPFMNALVVPKNEKDSVYQFSKDWVKLVVEFATDEKAMKFRNVPFPPLRKEGKLKYLRVDEAPRITDEPLEESMQFWKSLNVFRRHSEIVTKSLH